MDVIFSFDTEDYYRPESNDALLALARSHSRHGAPACFGIVGEKARFLRNRGRRDIIEALREHEIGYHSDHHFTNPDHSYRYPYIPEHLEQCSWDEAMPRLLAEESRGVHDVAEVFAIRPLTWLRNYGDYAAQYVHALSRLDLKVFAYGPTFRAHKCSPQEASWRPIWYCNMLSIGGPRMTYEDHLHDSLGYEAKLEAYKKTFLGHLEGGTPRLNVVTHPTQFCSQRWPLEDLFDRDMVPRAKWPQYVTPCYSPAKREALLSTVDEFIAFVARCPGVRIRTFRDLWSEYGSQPQWIADATVQKLANGIIEHGLRWQHDGKLTFSPAEIFALFVQRISAPDRPYYPLRHPLGPVKTPHENNNTGQLREKELITACRRAEDYLRDFDRVPEFVETAAGRYGPGAFLGAMAADIVNPEAESYALNSTGNLPVPLLPDDYRLIAAGKPASLIENREFRGQRLREAVALQYWTVKPAKPE